MHLSIPTIDKHLRLARENLNAKTTIQAMIRAQETQQLYNFNYLIINFYYPHSNLKHL